MKKLEEYRIILGLTLIIALCGCVITGESLDLNNLPDVSGGYGE